MSTHPYRPAFDNRRADPDEWEAYCRRSNAAAARRDAQIDRDERAARYFARLKELDEHAHRGDS